MRNRKGKTLKYRVSILISSEGTRGEARVGFKSRIFGAATLETRAAMSTNPKQTAAEIMNTRKSFPELCTLSKVLKLKNAVKIGR